MYCLYSIFHNLGLCALGPTQSNLATNQSIGIVVGVEYDGLTQY